MLSTTPIIKRLPVVAYFAAGMALPGQWRRFAKENPLGAFGALVMGIMVVLALGADIITPHNPKAINSEALFRAPGWDFFLGTDEFGRDLFSRLVFGARVSLYVGFVSVLIGGVLGFVLGTFAAYKGGVVDLVFQRVVDAMMTFPSLILAMILVATLGPSLNNVILAIAFSRLPQTARVTRSVTLAVKESLYVDAAVAMGATARAIVWRHIRPNVIAPFLILAAGQIGTAIVAEASLSFLGLGTPPTTPSWGAMLSGAATKYAEKAPWMVIFPGIAITLTVYSVNVLGDAVRDHWDPRLRHLVRG